MPNRRRRLRAARRAAATNLVGKCATTQVATPLVPAYRDCGPLDWVPDLNNAHLMAAAAGRLSIGDPFHHAPAPITFAPPGAVAC